LFIQKLSLHLQTLHIYWFAASCFDLTFSMNRILNTTDLIDSVLTVLHW